jgi:ketosteroid isomerase-like protein
MSQANVEVVRRAFAAIRARDVEALLVLFDPDVEVHSLLTEAERQRYRGREAAREWFRAVVDVFPDWVPRISGERDLDGAVVATLHVEATGSESGVPIEQVFWQAARVEDGRIVFFGFYRTEREALAAVGAA